MPNVELHASDVFYQKLTTFEKITIFTSNAEFPALLEMTGCGFNSKMTQSLMMNWFVIFH